MFTHLKYFRLFVFQVLNLNCRVLDVLSVQIVSDILTILKIEC